MKRKSIVVAKLIIKAFSIVVLLITLFGSFVVTDIEPYVSVIIAISSLVVGLIIVGTVYKDVAEFEFLQKKERECRSGRREKNV